MFAAEIVQVVGIKIGRDVVHKDVQQGMTKIFRKDVPRPLTNDLWVFLFQTIDAECVK